MFRFILTYPVLIWKTKNNTASDSEKLNVHVKVASECGALASALFTTLLDSSLVARSTEPPEFTDGRS